MLPRPRLGASLPVATGKPVTRCRSSRAPMPEAVLALLRSPLRLPGARRFGAWLLAPPESPPPREPEPFSPRSARRRRSEDSVSRPRLACAPRYGGYLRECNNPRSRGIFESPGLSPKLFRQSPEIFHVVHRSCTGISPDLRLGQRRRTSLTDAAVVRVEWPADDELHNSAPRDHHHYLEHVALHVLAQPPTGGFFVARASGTDRQTSERDDDGQPG